ncbi:MAG: hypothetical protein Q9198_001987 [Flavoplaca austrocitrina]
MDWDRFSGFVGEGTYVIINRASLTALEARSLANGSGCDVQGFAHCPHNLAQLWNIRGATKGCGMYYVENVREKAKLTATGQEGLIFGTPESANGPRFWVIDKGMLATEKGKMAV